MAFVLTALVRTARCAVRAVKFNAKLPKKLG